MEFTTVLGYLALIAGVFLGLFVKRKLLSIGNPAEKSSSSPPTRIVCLKQEKELEIQLQIDKFCKQFKYDTDGFETDQDLAKWLWENIYDTIIQNIAQENCTLQSLNRNLKVFLEKLSGEIDVRKSRRVGYSLGIMVGSAIMINEDDCYFTE